ncbi:tetratricopeptide repeat protein [Gloeocapsopsis crepidinum LEGE 06123]|uniref:Tetratricopeptide repeat protein n=1 Tax=Gloeocapsopsis crepidinum LEGE 06123 TaxID=588587 RepID=A0ABR9UPG1_9CHRO|nr:tetratricopeptide repeat protein [Gloeocapsopsis crepidinum]MBE9190177.1 tetratricopeptide repeat protein [Gloeocapsopsis crepidinum LEGE 06123]
MKKPCILAGLCLAIGTASVFTWTQPSLSLDPIKVALQSSENLQQAEVHNNQGVELAEQGRLAEAIAAFNRAISVYPEYENAHNNLGLALGNQNKFAEAIAAFNHAIEINPRNFETYNNLGIALGSQGKFAEAIAAFNRAIQINPNDPVSRQNLGVAFWSQGKVSQAVASLQRARELYAMQNNSAGMEEVGVILNQISLPAD